MRVLLLVNDIYSTQGGGQTYYKRIISDNPNINFVSFYTTDDCPKDLPPNLQMIKLQSHWDFIINKPIPFSEFWKGQLREALNFAYTVKGMAFDIIELPDYYTCGYFIKYAMKLNEVTFSSFVLSLHGNISNTLEHNWGSSGDCTLEHRILEQKQFEIADFRYGISEYYAEIWKSKSKLQVEILDPLSFIDLSKKKYSPKNKKTSIVNIARQERLKGDDLLVEIAAWINPSEYNKIMHIGSIQDIAGGATSDYALKVMAERRGVKSVSTGPLNRAEINKIFADNTIVCLPTRFDSLNLVALEALGAGCPIVVSDRAGVCCYLERNHPEIEFIKFSIDNLMDAVSKIEHCIKNYDQYRKKSEEAALILAKKQKKVNMINVYSNALKFKSETEFEIDIDIKKVMVSSVSVGPIVSFFRSHLRNTFVGNTLKPLYRKLYKNYIDKEISFHARSDVAKSLINFASQHEQSINALKNKLSTLYGMFESGVPKVNVYSEIARIERINGNLAHAICYDLRVGRLVPSLMPEIIHRVSPELRSINLGFIADALDAWSNSRLNNNDDLIKHFVERIEHLRNVNKNDVPISLKIDRRLDKKPRVSVIVSMYNAANKTKHFISHLSKSSLFNNGDIEVIFVDSCSPMDEKSAIDSVSNMINDQYLYIRTKDRDTIQGAWNLGLKFSRAEYVTFLGVDEGVFPLGLEILSDYLDKNKDIDWVQGNSVLSLVDEFGTLKTDAARYNRDGAHTLSGLIDTTYMTYVGGLYRKSIHERFGYYDTRFKAAGDTEFKCRVLGKIGVGYVKNPCGIFFDFPEERVTASCIAEIEDNIAWYAFRSPEGIKSILSNCSINDIENLYKDTTLNRKCYRDDFSTDIELNYSIEAAGFIESKYSALDVINTLTKRDFVSTLSEANDIGTLRQNSDRDYINWLKTYNPNINLRPYNDNRYEQHSWLWRTI